MASNAETLSDTGNWNVAPQYAMSKILTILIDLDDYEKIMEFGTLDLNSEFQLSEDEKNAAKYKAMRWVQKLLVMLINNTKFALKNQKDKDQFDEFKKQLKEVKKYLPHAAKEGINPRTKNPRTVLNHEIFNKLSEILINIKGDMLEPLNKNDMIFLNPDDFDPEELIRRTTEDMIYSG